MGNHSCPRRTREAAYISYQNKPSFSIRCASIRTSTGITRCDVFRLVTIFRGDNLRKMRFDFFQANSREIILYTSILFWDIRCRRPFRRSVVFTVSMSELSMARTLVLENNLQRRSLGRQVTEELDGSPRGRSRDKCISGAEYRLYYGEKYLLWEPESG